jgi:TonB family protein
MEVDMPANRNIEERVCSVLFSTRPEGRKMDLPLVLAISAHVVAAGVVASSSGFSLPSSASSEIYASRAEPTVDIIFFAEPGAGDIKSNSLVVAPPKGVPQYEIPQLETGAGLVLAKVASNGPQTMNWAMPALPRRDSTASGLPDIEELKSAPRYTPFARAPSLKNGDQIERLLSKLFPRRLRRDGGDARAIVWLLIDTEGRVLKSLLRETSGRTDVDSVAVTASQQMSFHPAEQAGRPVPVWVQQPVRFHVRDDQ